MGDIVGFAGLLQRKYDLLQQNANADTQRAQSGLITAKAGANLDDARAFGLPQQNLANLAQTQAQTAGLLEQNKYIGPAARSAIALQGSQAGQNAAQTRYLGSEAEGNTLFNHGIESSQFFDLLRKIRAQQPGQSGLGL